jgi:hypothetical protein
LGGWRKAQVKWLVVVDSKLMPSALQTILKQADARPIPASDPVPLSDDEVSIEVEGPEDLPSRLERNQSIKGVYPSSDYTLY